MIKTKNKYEIKINKFIKQQLNHVDKEIKNLLIDTKAHEKIPKLESISTAKDNHTEQP